MEHVHRACERSLPLSARHKGGMVFIELEKKAPRSGADFFFRDSDSHFIPPPLIETKREIVSTLKGGVTVYEQGTVRKRYFIEVINLIHAIPQHIYMYKGV